MHLHPLITLLGTPGDLHILQISTVKKKKDPDTGQEIQSLMSILIIKIK